MFQKVLFSASNPFFFRHRSNTLLREDALPVSRLQPGDVCQHLTALTWVRRRSPPPSPFLQTWAACPSNQVLLTCLQRRDISPCPVMFWECRVGLEMAPEPHLLGWLQGGVEFRNKPASSSTACVTAGRAKTSSVLLQSLASGFWLRMSASFVTRLSHVTLC